MIRTLREGNDGQPPQRCALCGRESRLIAGVLGLCRACIAARPDEARAFAGRVHRAARRLFDLPEAPPTSAAGVRCELCVQDCRIGEGERGFCGLRTARDGRLVHLAGAPARAAGLSDVRLGNRHLLQ